MTRSLESCATRTIKSMNVSCCTLKLGGFPKGIVWTAFIHYGTVVGCQEAVDSNFQQHISGIEHDVAYIADMFTHLKISNKMMQGDRTTFI